MFIKDTVNFKFMLVIVSGRAVSKLTSESSVHPWPERCNPRSARTRRSGCAQNPRSAPGPLSLCNKAQQEFLLLSQQNSSDAFAKQQRTVQYRAPRKLIKRATLICIFPFNSWPDATFWEVSLGNKWKKMKLQINTAPLVLHLSPPDVWLMLSLQRPVCIIIIF